MGNSLCSRFRLSATGQTRRAFLAATGGLLSAASAFTMPQMPIRWLAFYGMAAGEAVLATHQIVVLDAAFQGSISLIAGARVCGYLSLGEIRITDPLLMFLDRAALLREN